MIVTDWGRHCRSLTPLVAAVLFFVMGSTAYANVIKSPLDTSEYRYLELENGLRVILVSDPETDKAAASLDVEIGNGSDPAGREGLVHFLEHMLFLGTEKYPDAGEYQAFIKDHGGSHNAYTSYGHTNYFFSLQWQQLDAALDRFSQFFIAPLFNEELVQRERVIVDSEYSARSREEGRRTWAARRKAMNPEHPRSRFAVGSVDTLADRQDSSIRDELINFYKQNYSAHLMTLAVVGRQSLDELEDYVRNRFKNIARTNASRFVAEQTLFKASDLPILQQIKPLKERRSLTLSFEVPSSQEFYRSKPLYHLSNLLGHEGVGSLLHVLKGQGWAKSLSAGPSTGDSAQQLFEVSVSLTPLGELHIEEIGALVFRQISNVRDHGMQAWRFDEQRKQSETAFKFSEKPDASHRATALSSRMQDYPWQEVLFAPYRFDFFDIELTNKYIDLLLPERTIVTMVSPTVTTDQVEEGFATEFSISSLPAKYLTAWKSAPVELSALLKLPERNPFLPENLELVANENSATRPEKLISKEGLELWHYNDSEFGAPRSNFYFSIRSEKALGSPENMALSDLFTSVVNDRLNAWSYPAHLAGMEYELYPHLRGMSVRITGYSDKQSVLLQEVLAALKSDEFDAQRVSRIRESLLQSYRNRLKGSPASQSVSQIQGLLLRASWSIESRIAALENVDLAMLKSFARSYFDRMNILALSHGSRSSRSALQMASLIEEMLLDNAIAASVDRSSVVRLTDGQQYLRNLNIEHQDAVVAFYSQGKEAGFVERAKFFLLDQLMESDFYHELRTNQKLGYIVQISAMPVLEVPGILYLVQSPTTSSSKVQNAITQFLGQYVEVLKSLSVEHFEQAKLALISRIERRDNTLGERTSRYWRELDEKQFDFSSRKHLKDSVSQLTLRDMQVFYKRLMKSPTLLVQSPGDLPVETVVKDGAEMQISRLTILDPQKFKSTHAVF
ncbi:MAG: insulysin [Gammaproteobacteria bacterium]|jgi:insulysin